MQVTSGAIQNASLDSLVTTLDADGSISRADMIKILQAAVANGTVTAAELSDLKKIVGEAATLNMPSYVQALASDVVNGDAANATYQGAPLGNLAAGSSATQLSNLINKWFYGTDHPVLCNTSLVYKATAGSLFPHTPSHTDECQASGRLLFDFGPGDARRQQSRRDREHDHQQRRRHLHRPLLQRALRSD